MKKSNFKQFSRARGFTIVELLVVIVVIGILAAITLVSYTGVTQRAATVTLKSDLKNASTKLSLYNVTNSNYPADLASATAADVLPKSPNTTFQYTLTGSSYCLSATSLQAGNSAYHYSSLVGTIESGVCEGHELSNATYVEVLVVAGGGGGGRSEYSDAGDGAGGGGAGGYISNNHYSVSTDNTSVTVGNGGAGSSVFANRGSNGDDSSFGTLVAVGGGGGGSDNDDATGVNMGAAGGSGGGAASRYSYNVASSSFVNNQGFAGGNAPSPGNICARGGGGGGGGGGAGSFRNGSIGGAGGVGLANSITGTSIYYAGGGGGGGSCGYSGGGGGLGGGASGGSVNAGTINTGGGGGGATAAMSRGSNGGSGIVVIRYLTASMSASSTNSAVSGLYTIHTFTTSGTFTVN